MNASTHALVAVAATSSLVDLFERQQQAARREVDVPLALRQGRLQRLTAMWRHNEGRLAQAVGQDFGLRGERLTQLADALVLDSVLADLRRNLARWSRPRRVRTPLHLLPARAHVLRQPLGVVGALAGSTMIAVAWPSRNSRSGSISRLSSTTVCSSTTWVDRPANRRLSLLVLLSPPARSKENLTAAALHGSPL